MGNRNASQVFEGYKQKGTKKIPLIGKVQIYQNPDRPDLQIIDKQNMNSVQFKASNNDVEQMSLKADRLNPRFIFPGRLTKSEVVSGGFCSKACIRGDLTFDSGTLSLKDYMYSHHKSNPMPLEEQWSLLDFLIKGGCHLEDKLDFHPKISQNSIFVTQKGPRLQNPILYDQYILAIIKVNLFSLY